ncbi:MAG: alpha/beta fold hydrolase [Acidimicrobiia bacterium]|nr:alpha/beta fold hydrolase [Acidimicrobiia bacterium]
MNTIANGVRLHYDESGAGLPVVCLHGLGLNGGVWRNQTPVLAHRFRTIVYDLRGMGRSEAPGRRGTVHPISLHVDDLGGLFDALGIDRAILVAHAYGAFVTMQFAATYPQRVRAMVVVNTSAMMGEPGISQALFRAATAELDGMAPLLDVAMSRWFVKSFHHERPDVIQFYREMLAATPPLGYAASARAIGNMDLRPLLPKINCPTLVVAGANDWSTPPAGHALIADTIPNGKLVVVEGASHTVPEEQPDEFNRLMLEFLAQALGKT